MCFEIAAPDATDTRRIYCVRLAILHAACFALHVLISGHLGPAQANASTIVLACDGFASGPAHSALLTGEKSFILDLQNGTVLSSLGDFSITHSDGREIRFEGRHQLQDGGTGLHVGRLDRITGDAVTWATRDGEKDPFLTYIFYCRPAQPKF